MDSPLSDDKAHVPELSFAPRWVQGPENPYVNTDRSNQQFGKKERREPSLHTQGKRRSSRTHDLAGRSVPRRDKQSVTAGSRAPSEEKPERGADRADAVTLPAISFIPAMGSLAPIARRLAHSGRAYSLFEVAAFFLREPNYYAVKIAVPLTARASGRRLYQCERCKCVFTEESEAISHALVRHFNDFYNREERQGDPPEGNFVCVARCGISGELLGPPNFHLFNDNVIELHRTRFSHMSLDEYRRKIVNVRDSELVERWRQGARKLVVYTTRLEPEQITFTRFSDLEAHFTTRYGGSVIRSSSSFVVAGVVPAMENGTISNMIRKEWSKECRFPLNFAIVLKSAFKRFGLHTFKAGNGEIFVTSVVPSFLDPAEAIVPVRKVLEYLAEHPGVSPLSLFSGAFSDAGNAEAREAGKHLRWLIDKGHLIEFSDGTLALPPSPRQK